MSSKQTTDADRAKKAFKKLPPEAQQLYRLMRFANLSLSEAGRTKGTAEWSTVRGDMLKLTGCKNANELAAAGTLLNNSGLMPTAKPKSGLVDANGERV